MDDFDYICPSCSHMMTLPLSFHGKEGACPRCDNHDAWTATTVPIDDPLDLQLDPLEDNYDGQTVLSGVGAEDSGLFTFVFMCPFCTHEIALPQKVYGKKGKCSQCGKSCNTAMDLRRLGIFRNLKTGVSLVLLSTVALILLQVFLIVFTGIFYNPSRILSPLMFNQFEFICGGGVVLSLLGYWCGCGFTMYEWSLDLRPTWTNLHLGKWSSIKSITHFSVLTILIIILTVGCLGTPVNHWARWCVFGILFWSNLRNGFWVGFLACQGIFQFVSTFIFSTSPIHGHFFNEDVSGYALNFVYFSLFYFFHVRFLLKKYQQLKLFCDTKTLAGQNICWELNV